MSCRLREEMADRSDYRLTMATGGGGEGLVGRKRRSAEDDMPPARREPKRGLGVAALESIRTHMETSGDFYLCPSPPPPPPPPPLLLPPSMLLPGVRFNPYIGNGAVPRDYYPQYYGAPHYSVPSSGYLQQHQLQPPNVHAVPRYQNHQPEQNVAAPLLDKDYLRRAQAAYGQMMKRPPVAFVDLVDSDDDDEPAGAEEEPDLELRL